MINNRWQGIREETQDKLYELANLNPRSQERAHELIGKILEEIPSYKNKDAIFRLK